MNDPTYTTTWIPYTGALPADQLEIVVQLASGICRFGRMIDGHFCDYDPTTDHYLESTFPFGPKGITYWLPLTPRPGRG